MIKSDIVDRVAEITDVPRVKAAQAVDTIIEAMKIALCEGKRIELRGFGVFQSATARRAWDAIPRPASRWPSPPARRSASSPART